MAYVRFRGTQLELDEANLGLFHTCRSASGDDDILVQDNAAIDKLGVLNRSSHLFYYPDIAKVDVRRRDGG